MLLLVVLTLETAAVWAESGGKGPDTLGCCTRQGVDDDCARLLCRVEAAPSHMQVFSGQFKQCSRWLPTAAACLADGRNHLGCCQADAERPESACFDLCQGTAPATALNSSHMDDSAYVSYMSCLAFNVATIYKCFRKGYEAAPTPPVGLIASDISHNSASLSWHPPQKYPESVANFHLYYQRHLPGTSAEKQPRPNLVSMQRITTSQRSHHMEGLSPNTKYTVYAVSATRDAKHLSLPSEPAEFTTNGIAPKIQAFLSKDVEASRAANQILVCKIDVLGLELPKLQIGWSKKAADDSFHPLTHSSILVDESRLPKYFQTAYQSRLDLDSASRSVITTLTIRAATQEDYGAYLCSVNNSFGNAAAEINLRPPRPVHPPSSPFAATADCGGQLGIPTSGAGNAPDPSAYLQKRAPSVLDLIGLLSCAIRGRRNAGCCLRRRVPDRCLGLCDEEVGSGEARGFQLFSCLPFSSAIFQCDMEAKAALPAAPRGLRARPDNGDLVVSWEPVEGAIRYHLYRALDDASSSWSRLSSDVASVRLSGASEERLRLTVVAESEGGLSGPSHSLSWPHSRRPSPAAPSSAEMGASPQKLRLVAGQRPAHAS